MTLNREFSMNENRSFVTSLEEYDKTRVKVYIDGKFAFVLYKSELRSLEIEQDEVISQETLQEVYEKLLPLRGKKRALNLLQKKSYTEKQLRDKLESGFYPDEIIDIIIEYVKQYHYIDDLQYAKDYITYYSEYRSRGRIEMDLWKKGIEKEIVKDAYYALNEDTELTDETVLIKAILEKKHYDYDMAGYEEKQKMTAYLYRKGFQIDKIHQMLEKQSVSS